MFRQRKSLWLVIALVVSMVFVISGCGDDSISVLKPAGPVAEEQLWLMTLGITIMVFVVVVVFAIWGFVLFRFRKRKGEQPKSEAITDQVQGNHKLEIIWTVIPFILLLILAVPTIISIYDLEKTYSKEEALQVKVIGHQYWWEFQYPDLGIVTANDLYIPEGKKIQFDITSEVRDVKHSFWVPSIAGKIDANPGRNNKMWFQADKEGVFRGKCAELCGASHALMDFKVVVLNQTKFDKWAKDLKAFKDEPTTAEAKKGKAIFRAQCLSCHAIGNGASIAPNLTLIGDRVETANILPNNVENPQQPVDPKVFRDNMHNWLTNTDTVKPGNEMGIIPLKEEDKKALIEYLAGLRLNK